MNKEYDKKKAKQYRKDHPNYLKEYKKRNWSKIQKYQREWDKKNYQRKGKKMKIKQQYYTESEVLGFIAIASIITTLGIIIFS